MFLMLQVLLNPTIRWNSYEAKVKKVVAPFVLVLLTFICLLIGYICHFRSNSQTFCSFRVNALWQKIII